MRVMFFIWIVVNVCLSGCFYNKAGKKIYVRSVQLSNGLRIDWFVLTSNSNFAPDYLQTSANLQKPFFVSFFVGDIKSSNDTLFISLWKNDYDLKNSKLPGIEIVIDTLGKTWNQAVSRIGRLRRRGVEVESPHFIDTYCPNGECENENMPIGKPPDLFMPKSKADTTKAD